MFSLGNCFSHCDQECPSKFKNSLFRVTESRSPTLAFSPEQSCMVWPNLKLNIHTCSRYSHLNAELCRKPLTIVQIYLFFFWDCYAGGSQKHGTEPQAMLQSSWRMWWRNWLRNYLNPSPTCYTSLWQSWTQTPWWATVFQYVPASTSSQSTDTNCSTFTLRISNIKDILGMGRHTSRLVLQIWCVLSQILSSTNLRSTLLTDKPRLVFLWVSEARHLFKVYCWTVTSSPEAITPLSHTVFFYVCFRVACDDIHLRLTDTGGTFQGILYVGFIWILWFSCRFIALISVLENSWSPFPEPTTVALIRASISQRLWISAPWTG